MSAVSDVAPVRQFCSVNAKALGADPLGTAPMYDEFIMLEFDLPWARNVVDSAGFPEGVAAAVEEVKGRGRRLQLQCFAPDGRYSKPGMRRVMYFSRSVYAEAAGVDGARGVGAAMEYVPVEYVVPTDDVEALIRFLLLGDGDSDGARFESFLVVRGHGRDLFVCTHGARDACCGKYGATVQLELDALATGTVTQRETAATTENSVAHNGQAGVHDLGAAVSAWTRVWRVNHLGGHRFAPTLLELPAARYWGALESGVLQALVDGPTELDRLRPYYRGWSGVDSPAEQVAEAEAWLRIGPRWLEYDKTIRPIVRADGGLGADALSLEQASGTEIVIEWTDPRSGSRGHIEVGVEVSRLLTLPESCGAEEVHSEQYAVSRYDEIDPGDRVK